MRAPCNVFDRPKTRYRPLDREPGKEEEEEEEKKKKKEKEVEEEEEKEGEERRVVTPWKIRRSGNRG